MARNRFPPASFLSAALMLVLAACQDSPGSSPQSPASSKKPPIVLISIDTLRSDRLPIYGYTGVETPAIDRLRRDGVLFERAYSHTPLTLPSHVSILTGLLPHQHQVRDNQGYTFKSAGGFYLPRRLRELGFATGAAVSAFVLRPETGLAAEFDFYDADIEERTGVALGGVARSGEETLERAVAWMRSVAGEPFFLLFHIFEPHMPYTPPEPFASRFASPYDGEIAEADRIVGALLAELERLGLYDEALVLLLSDHGEGLGDHGEEEHGVFLYREVLQVPLVLKWPRQERAGTQVAAPAQLVDVVPTILALLGEPVPDELPGLPLLTLPDAPARKVYAETFFPRLHYGWSELASLIDGRYHYIEAPRPELYDLEADFAETENILAEERGIYREFRDALAAYPRELEAPADVAPEERARLAALGYLGSASPARGELPDPKDKFPSLEVLKEAYRLYRAGDHAAAVVAFREVLRENPGMIDAREYLGESLLELGRPGEALEVFEEAFRRSEGKPRLALSTAAVLLRLGQLDDARELLDYAARGGEEAAGLKRRLGLALAAAGRAGEAVAVLRPLAATREVAALAALGLALSENGDQPGARAALEEALVIEPDHAPAFEHLGLVALRTGNFQKAAEFSERAVQIEPARARAWNNLGVAAYNLGKKAAALDAWEKAIGADPKDYDALYNLALVALEERRIERSRRALRRFLEEAPEERAADRERAASLLRQIGPS